MSVHLVKEALRYSLKIAVLKNRPVVHLSSVHSRVQRMMREMFQGDIVL